MVLVLSGPSGVGKTTVRDAILRGVPGAFFSVSATTRARPGADRVGVDYHFIAPGEFDRLVRDGAFIEHAEYAGNRYGTLRAPVEDALRAGRLVVLDIDVVGAANVKKDKPGAFSLFFLAPSDEELLRRLRARRRDTEEAIQKRFAAARKEMEFARASGVYDNFIVNDRIEETVERTLRRVREEMARRAAGRGG